MSGIIVLTVTREGNIYIGDETGRAGQVPKDQIQEHILNARGRRPRALIILKGDKDAKFGAVSDVISALQRTETLRFNLMTDLETTPKKAAAGHGEGS
jgi:biopolymer transport protein ExbD